MATNEEKLRCRALHVVFKYSKCENFDASIPYLAMTYFDRFISGRDDISISTATGSVLEHDVELLALCCLTLAWKRRSESFNTDEFWHNQPDLQYFTKDQVQKMETQILKALGQRLDARTALSFVPDIATKFYLTSGISRRTINEIIISSHDSTLVRKQRPSIIAASAFLAASKYLYPDKYQIFYSQMMLDGMFKRSHEKRFLEYMIKLCSDLKLIIESNDVPKRRVRAGEEAEGGAGETSEHGAAETSEHGAAETSEKETGETSEQGTIAGFNFPLRWRICEPFGEKFVAFRPLSESAELDWLAFEASRQPDLRALYQLKRYQVDRVEAPVPETRDQPQIAHVQGPRNGCCNTL
ncbi:Cyclin [Parasponia andersonii]|uniref:B-like cyclin n=1 Tax=Parasponia andersonii TaxID=3476 RepID=A0A2P5B919_PARAD|nr:Cyclin [Parasponia andersonii]